MKILIFMMIFGMPLMVSYAGNEGGNGGDTCESRIKDIGSDIEHWIQGGGSNGLKLNELSIEQYNHNMLDAIRGAVVSCTEDKILIANVEKSCRNFVGENGEQNIECNYKRFNGLSEAEQYHLIHHEYAGLARLETNNGPSSEYKISNQVTSFLEDQIVKKLAIKKNENHYGPGETIELKKGMKVVYVVPNSKTNEIFYDGVIKSVFERSVEICYESNCHISSKERVAVSDPSISISLADGRTFKIGEYLSDGTSKALLAAVSVRPIVVREGCMFCSKSERLDREAVFSSGSKYVVRFISLFQKEE